MSDRGRKYQTIDRKLKTKTEMNRESYFKWIQSKVSNNIEPVHASMDEELFWRLTSREINNYFFGN